MLSLVDIKGMCECTEEEIEAIAMHENVPEVIASEMAAYWINCPDGIPRIRCIIRDDIEQAKRLGNIEQADRLNSVLMHFIASHPESTAGMRV